MFVIYTSFLFYCNKPKVPNPVSAKAVSSRLTIEVRAFQPKTKIDFAKTLRFRLDGITFLSNASMKTTQTDVTLLKSPVGAVLRMQRLGSVGDMHSCLFGRYLQLEFI